MVNMIRLTILLVVLLSGPVLLRAQPYGNIITRGTAFYTGGNYEPGMLSGLRADTAQSLGNGDTLFFSNNTIRRYYQVSQYDFSGSLCGRKILKHPNGDFHFINQTGDTLLLQTGAP